MRRTTVIQWLLSLLAFSVLLGFSSFFFWVSANPQRLTGNLSLPDNRGAVIAGEATPILLETNAGYVTDATLTIVGEHFVQAQTLERSTRPWRAETTWRTPAAMQPYTLTARFTTFDGTTVTAKPLSIDVVPPGTIAYVQEPADGGTPAVYVMQTDGSTNHLWAENATKPAWGPDGTLYFVRDGAVWQQRSADGPAELVAGTQIGVVAFSLGDPLALVDGSGRLILRNTDGTLVQPRLDVETIEDVAWHPNGEELLLAARRNGNVDLYIWSRTSSALERVTTRSVSDTQPAWKPDGTKIVFTAPPPDSIDGTQINWLSLSPRSEGPSVITEVPFGADEASWNPVGDWIVYVGQNTSSPTSREIVLQRIDDPYAVQITRTDTTVHSPAWRMP